MPLFEGLQFSSDCMSCNTLLITSAALDGFDERVFSALASGVTTIGSSITTLALMIILIMRSQFGLEVSASPQTANEVFGIVARLAWCAGLLASFPFWKFYIIGTIDNIIAALITTAMLGLDDLLVDYSLPEGMPSAHALKALYATENAMFTPLEKILDNVKETIGWSPASIANGGMIYIAISIIMFLAVLDLALVSLFYGEFMFWRFMLTAFGPIIAFAWVFPQTRPAAWTSIKLLIQSGLTIVMSTGVIAILVASFALITKLSPVQDNGTDVEALTQFFSFTGFGAAAFSAIYGLFLLVIIKGVSMFIVFGSPGTQAGKGVMSVVSKIRGGV